MKKSNYIIIVAVLGTLFTSCANTYQFCQVCETKPVQQDGILKNSNGELRYENAQCIIDYNFWSNGGTVDFEFYNKTDEIIYIDLAKSFYVMNGEAYDLYLNREWSQSSTVGHASSVAYGYGESRSVALAMGRIEPVHTPIGDVSAKTARAASRSANYSSNQTVAYSKSNAVTIKEKPVIAVPPHSKKYVKAYEITTTPMLSCKLPRYPSDSARLDFNLDNTPYRFSDIITYTVGSSTQPIIINNEFYVSSVTNYAEPEIVIMQKRNDICENLREPDYVNSYYELYDKVIRDSICETASSFYNTYSTKANKKLYQDNSLNSFRYDNQLKAYVNSKSQSTSSGSSNKKVATGVFLSFIGLLLVVVFAVK